MTDTTAPDTSLRARLIRPRSAALCMGYGGLDIAVEEVFGAETVWCSEIDADACRVIARRWPEVTNHGDLKRIDWSELEPIDILTAGYPCQPFSQAGNRRGTDDPRHLWPFIADAVRVLRPRLVVLENVSGHLSLGFDTVLADLAEVGFDAEWVLVRASDVGACHQRARLFVLATDAERVEGGQRHDADLLRGWQGEAEQARLGGGAPADASGQRHGRRQDGRSVGRVDGDDAGEALERQRARQEPRDRGDAAHADTDGRRRVERDEGQRRVPVAHEGGADDADAERFGLPWVDEPGVGEGLGVPGREPARAHPEVAWGDYEPAIRRHGDVLGRPAPSPVDDLGRLSHHFVEWMQMLPEGHVTRVEHMKRNPALKLLGNGVVPPQAAYAVRLLLEREAVAA